MGTWGTSVFGDDGGADLRAEYKELLGSGLSDDEALAALLSQWQADLDEPDEGGGLRIALALTMHRLGRLTPEVLAAAIEAIDAGPDERYDTPALRRSRTAVFEKARAELLTEQPERKRIPKRWMEHTDLRPGDVLAITTNGRSTLLKVVRVDEYWQGRAPVVITLNWNGAQPPPRWRLRFLRPLTTGTVTYVRRNHADVNVPSATTLMRDKRTAPDWQDAGFQLIGRAPVGLRARSAPGNGHERWASAAARIASGEWFTVINATWHLGWSPADGDPLPDLYLGP